LVSPPSGTPNQQAFENARAFAGDVYLARTTNGGNTWEPARKIFKAGTRAQTIGNLIVVLPDNAAFNGELLDVFTLIRETKNAHGTRGFHIPAIRPPATGRPWSNPGAGRAPAKGGVLWGVAGKPVRPALQHRVLPGAGGRLALVLAHEGQSDP